MRNSTYLLSLVLTALLCLPWGNTAWADETLTVADGTATNSNVPVWGYWGDAEQHNQLIYPSSLLTEMVGKNIKKMTFYVSSPASAKWTSTFTIGLAVVEESSISGDGGYYATYYHNSAEVTTIYNGELDGTGSTMVVEFNEAFYYEGGNLLFDLTSTGGNYKDASFYGENQSATANIASHGNKTATSSSTGSSFLPKTTFTYTAAAPVTCDKPTDLEVPAGNITSSSALITWAGANNTVLEYKLHSASEWTVVSPTTTATTHLLTGLDNPCQYDVRVKNVCGGTDGESKYETTSFVTPCGPKALPFGVYGFEDVATAYNLYNVPECWDKVASGNYPYVYGYNSGKSGNSVYFKGGVTGSSEQVLILPELDAELSTLSVSFYHKESKDETYWGTDYVYAKFEVGYVKSGVFTGISGALDQLEAFATEPTEIALTGSTIPSDAKLAIRYAGGVDNGNGYIDDIRVYVTPSCSKPTLGNATDITPDGATFSWTAGGTETQWQYCVVAKDAEATGWSEPTTEHTYTITGKNANTAYDFYVRSYCDEGSQSDGVKKSFTTAIVAAPTNVAISAITTTGATASWTAAAGITTYQYCVVEAGNEPTWNKAVDNVSVALGGLSASTSYDFYVRSFYAANGATAAAAKVNFRTACDAETASWSEDFEDETANAVPACWSNAGSTATTSTTYGAPTEAIWAVYSYSSNKSIRMCNAYANTGVAQVTSPVITLPVSPAYEFKFDYAHTATCGNFKVQISTDGGASFTDLGEYGPTVASPSEYNGGTNPETFKTDEVISLAAYSGNIVLRFVANSDYKGGAIFIDNIAIREAPSCFKPATLAEASAITPNGATFSWMASASNNENYYQYICVPTGETPDWATSTKVAKAEENQAVISGLAAGTYDFYVRSWCAEEDQSEAVKGSFTTATIPAPASVSVTGITNNRASAEWTAPSVAYAVQYQYSLVQSGDPVWSAATSDLSHLFEGLEANTNYTLYVRTYFDAAHVGAQASTSFTTMCDPIVISSVAYKEDFSSFPVCWDNSEGSTTNSSYKWSSVAGGKEGNGMRFEGVDNDLGNTNIFASPFFTLNADADLTFYWKNAKTGEYKVQIAVKGGAREDLVTGLVSTNAWTKAEKALTEYQGKTIQLFFCGTSANDGNANLYLDELSITPVSCRKPAALNEATAITTDGATLTWTAGGADDYQYAVAEVGTAEGDLVWNNISAQSVTLTGLQASTSYDFYVRTYCDGENQSEARKVNFKTTCGVAVLPFEENFNTTARLFIPDCWNNTEGTSADSYKWSVETYSGKNSTNGVRFNSSTNDDGATSILATPEIQLGAEKYILSFWCKNPTGGDFKVQIEGEDIAREDLLTGLTGIADWTLKYIEVPAKFANKKVQLFFCGTSNAGDANAYISVDNIRVARGEIFADGGSPESRLAALNGETIDFVMERPMQFNGYYNTLCLPFDLSAAQLADLDCPLYNNTVKIFDYATIVDAGEMELQLAIASASDIQAGVPCFVKYDGAAGAVRNNFLFKEVRIAASTAGSKEDSGVEYRGIFNPVGAQGQAYIFVGAENQLYWPGENRTMNNFRAYFYVSENAAVGNIPVRRGMIARIVEREETATGINEISNDSSIRAQKVLENDQVIIIRNGVKYNMQGQKIQ